MDSDFFSRLLSGLVDSDVKYSMKYGNSSISSCWLRPMGYRSQTPHRALASLGPRAPSRSWPKPTRAQARSLLPSFSCSPRRLAAQPRPSVGWSLPPVATATRGDPPAAADHHPHTLLVYRRPSAGPSRRSLPQPAARRDPLAVATITLSGSTAVPYVAVLPLAVR